MTENQGNQPKKPTINYAKESGQILGVAFELGFLIALPIVILALGGKRLDLKYHTHYFVYLGILTAIVVTCLLIYKRFSALLNTLKKAGDIKDDIKTDSKETK
jgi:pheromone shutdown protein TraB